LFRVRQTATSVKFRRLRQVPSFDDRRKIRKRLLHRKWDSHG
jgi:hypothetical protein